LTPRILLVAGLAALLSTAGAAAAQRPTLRVVDSAPLRLRGAGFHASERVVVTLHMGAGRWTARTRADFAGAFGAGFGRVRLRACALPLSIVARGARGDVARAALPVRDCAPSRADP